MTEATMSLAGVAVVGVAGERDLVNVNKELLVEYMLQILFMYPMILFWIIKFKYIFLFSL